MLTLPPGGFKTANAHIRRITLNLMRHAASCPDDVVVVADKLAEARWDWNVLTKLEAEVIFTYVTGPAAEAALGEFFADTRTIHDITRDRGTADRAYIDDDGDTHCPLCGHKHIRWGFVVRNDAGGKDFRCGSSCVIQYGLRVDGEATAEAALKKLNAAIAGMQQKATREDWQEQRPDHEDQMAIVAQAEDIVARCAWKHPRQLPYKVRARMRDAWGGWPDRVWKEWAKNARAAGKYYRKNAFLTAKRTAWLDGGGLESARAIVAQYEASQMTRHRAEWRRFFAMNPLMNAYKRGKLTGAMENDDDPAALPGWLRGLYDEVIAENSVTLPPPPVVGLRPGFYMGDDLTDLPF